MMFPKRQSPQVEVYIGRSANGPVITLRVKHADVELSDGFSCTTIPHASLEIELDPNGIVTRVFEASEMPR